MLAHFAPASPSRDIGAGEYSKLYEGDHGWHTITANQKQVHWATPCVAAAWRPIRFHRSCFRPSGRAWSVKSLITKLEPGSWRSFERSSRPISEYGGTTARPGNCGTAWTISLVIGHLSISGLLAHFNAPALTRPRLIGKILSFHADL